MNEAAERLRGELFGRGLPQSLHDQLDAALAAERRATVERIRTAIDQSWVAFGEEWTTQGTEPGTRVPLIRASNIHAVLDEEAAR